MNSINNKNKNKENNQRLRSMSSIEEDRTQFLSYYDHHKKRQYELAKRRNKAVLNSMFFSSNL